MMLKRQYSLVALVVELDTSGSSAMVRLTLEANDGEQPHVLWSKSLEAERIGLTPQISIGESGIPNDSFKLPCEVSQSIRAALRDLEYDGVLWLHLVKPYGVLGALPWERLLESCGHPILRLPDAIADDAVETPETLNVILCVSMPISEEHFSAAWHLTTMVARIIESAKSRDVRVYIFADSACAEQASTRLRKLGLMGKQVFIIDPESSRDYKIPHGDRGEHVLRDASPWLQWMAKSLDGKSVDVVHFLCHGYQAEGAGYLAFAESPVLAEDPQWCRVVGARELNRFLVYMGAWSVSFSAPQLNCSSFGLRGLADKLAQFRPGPVLYHDIAYDPDCAQFAAACRLMYSGEEVSPMPMPAIALCHQPSKLPRMRAEHTRMMLSAWLRRRNITRAVATWLHEQGVTTAGMSGNTPLIDLPGWLASAHRFIEQKEYEVRLIEKAAKSSTARSALEHAGVKRGVDEVKKTLERLKRKGVL